MYLKIILKTILLFFYKLFNLNKPLIKYNIPNNIGPIITADFNIHGMLLTTIFRLGTLNMAQIHKPDRHKIKTPFTLS